MSRPAAAIAVSQSSPVHELRLAPQNVHWGYYDAAVKPVLRVASGDTIRVETMVARGLQRMRAAGVTEDEIPESLKAVENAVTERGPGAHPMTGPVWVEGAEPGDVLEVRILAFEFLHPYGVTGFLPDNGTLPHRFSLHALQARALRRARRHRRVRAGRHAEAGALLRIDWRRSQPAGRTDVERPSRSSRR